MFKNTFKTFTLLAGLAGFLVVIGSAVANLTMFASMFFGGSDDEDRPNPLVLLVLAMVSLAASVTRRALLRSREFEADDALAEVAK